MTTMARNRARLPVVLRRLALTAGVTAAVLLAVTPPAAANHGDIHARCVGNTPVITQRPAGMEDVTVICRGGFPEFMVNPPTVPVYDPVTRPLQTEIPPDFGGWVTVWLNGRPLKAPYDPVRGVQEPEPYVTASTGRVMMPVRFFTEAFGGTASWNPDERRARLIMWDKGKVLQLWAGKLDATVNMSGAKLDQAPVIFRDRMFVPVRFLVEGFGAEIKWDHPNRSARITLSGSTCGNPVYCGEAR